MWSEKTFCRNPGPRTSFLHPDLYSARDGSKCTIIIRCTQVNFITAEKKKNFYYSCCKLIIVLLYDEYIHAYFFCIFLLTTNILYLTTGLAAASDHGLRESREYRFHVQNPGFDRVFRVGRFRSSVGRVTVFVDSVPRNESDGQHQKTNARDRHHVLPGAVAPYRLLFIGTKKKKKKNSISLLRFYGKLFGDKFFW